MKTLILPGWAVPSGVYQDLPFAGAEIFDYGFYDSGRIFDQEAIKAEISASIDGDCVIAAHSLGTMFALEAAAASEHVKALVLYAPFARFSAADGYSGQPEKIIKAMRLQLRRNPAKLLEAFVANMAAPELYEIELPEDINREALDAGLECLMNYDVRDILDLVKCPVLVISGTEDRIAAEGQTGWLSGNLAGCSCCEIAGAGHAVPFTRIEEYGDRLNKFMGLI